MKLIAHRRNTIEELIVTPVKYGIEVDIRSYGDHLVIHHDPFEQGESFEAWLAFYNHGTLILNVKEEGLEARLIKLMEIYRISDFFFLDQSFPFLLKWSKLGEIRCAVRISEFESINTALKLSRKIDWVWVDCFNHFPLNKNDALELKDAGFKLCLVSPELHEIKADEVIKQFIVAIRENAINPDAVCTKRPDLWEAYF
jgi:hypothetical protein